MLQTRAYVHDPFQSQKPSSQSHATEKTDPSRNVQSEAVDKGMKAKKNPGPDEGQKKRPEDTTRAPGPVIGMQDERGKLRSKSGEIWQALRLTKAGGKEH